MAAGAEKKEDQVFPIDTINEKPVRPDMTFAKADIITGQGMVTVFVRQRLPGGKLIDDGVERIQIKAAFGSELEVFLEAVGKNDIKHPRVPHSWHPEKKRSAYTFLGVLSSRHTRSARLPFLHWDSPE